MGSESDGNIIVKLMIINIVVYLLAFGRACNAAEQESNIEQGSTWIDRIIKLRNGSILSIVSLMKFYLTKENLALRGLREFLDGEGNPGNFIKLTKLISNIILCWWNIWPVWNGFQYFFCCLLPSIRSEFTELLARLVKQQIIEIIKFAEYYIILFDRTPDISHNDQMAQIIRYGLINDGIAKSWNLLSILFNSKGKQLRK